MEDLLRKEKNKLLKNQIFLSVMMMKINKVKMKKKNKPNKIKNKQARKIFFPMKVNKMKFYHMFLIKLRIERKWNNMNRKFWISIE